MTLETLRVGGTLCTSLEALQRFCDRLTGGQQQAAATARMRRHDADAAAKELDRVGI